MNAERFRKIVESLEIDVPVLRAEELPGGGVRFYLYGGRIVDFSAGGALPAAGEGVTIESVRKKPSGRQGAAPGGKKPAPGRGR